MPVSVNIAPIIPGLTDVELPRLLEAVADAGARRVAWVLLRLPHQLKELFLDWLERNVHPERARHVESLIRQARGGKLYDTAPRNPRPRKPPLRGPGAEEQSRRTRSAAEQQEIETAYYIKHDGHDRRRGSGVHVENLKTVFDVYCRKFGLNRDLRPLTSRHFRHPDVGGQASLF